MSSSATGRTLILGVGNVLWADEGAGPRSIELLLRRLNLSAAEVVDGGTQGLYLLPMVTEAQRLLLFDAVDLGLPPGEVVVLEGEAIFSAFTGGILSLHQTSLHDLLAAAYLVGWQPEHVALIGIQAMDTENWGGDLSQPVAAALGEAIDRAEKILLRWGEPFTPMDDRLDRLHAKGPHVMFREK